ncbi:hypothetical protein HF086_000326 [Spodoptera exigua]|uniref:Uncharacterized protein n=1 Tax=Spodoptera exigua TaxID=7107 RepID=A0A922SN26_SPOEX|nr:hypothetical protein HF086_000326 [Spodoptera exigua]
MTENYFDMDNPTLEALQCEVDFFRQNQTIVEEEIRTLIADNQKLSQQVGMLLKEKLDNARANSHNLDHTKELEELRKQVSLLAKERDSLHVLWQTSQKTIDALETELKTYQSYDNGVKKPTKEERRDFELKLETALTDYIDLENKHKDLQTKHAVLENDLKCREKEIATYKERGKELEEKLSDVAEALQLYDEVSKQKNEAYKTVQELSREISQLKHTLSNIRLEIETSCRKEMDEVKEKENKILLASNESYLKQQKDSLKSVDPKLALAEQKVEAMFQELVASERRNMQLALQVEHLQKSLEETHGMVNKLQSMLASRTELNQKWKESYLEMKEKLKKKLEEMQEENKELRSKLKLPYVGSSEESNS